jgi:hypothetical protein
MMSKARQLPTLDRPAAYEIRVPGEIRTGWASWVEEMTVTIEREGDDPPVTAITGTFDQAALLGLLRRLYSLGVPLISVNWIDAGVDLDEARIEDDAGEIDLEPDS